MIRHWLRDHPLLGYVALAFTISWGGILTILAARGFDLSPMLPLEAGLILAAMLLGPSVSGLILTVLMDGRAGMHQLGARLLRRQFGAHWYAVALLTMPAILLTLLWLLSAAIDPAYSPRFQWPLFAVGLIAGSFEEIGWIGRHAVRREARRRAIERLRVMRQIDADADHNRIADALEKNARQLRPGQ